jgi:hypothetical protein
MTSALLLLPPPPLLLLVLEVQCKKTSLPPVLSTVQRLAMAQ